MLAQSNGQQVSNPHEAASQQSGSMDASLAALRPSEGAAPPQPLSVDDANDGQLTDIDLGTPPEAAATPEPDDPVPLSTPLGRVEHTDGLSNGAAATPPPRPAEASSSSSPAEDPREIVLGDRLQSITLTTYEDSVPLSPGTVTAGDQASDKQVKPGTLRLLSSAAMRSESGGTGRAQTSLVKQASSTPLLIEDQVLKGGMLTLLALCSSLTMSRWTGGCDTRGRAAEGRSTPRGTCRHRQQSGRCRHHLALRRLSRLGRPSGQQLTSSSG